jgi:uncharacterized OB-fold protein
VQETVDPDSIGFWQSLQQGEVRLTRCSQCRYWQHPPLERCRKCGGVLQYEPISGRGTVYSAIVVHYQGAVADGGAPHVVGLVEVDEQPGLRLLGVSDRPLTIGEDVWIRSGQRPDGTTYVKLEQIGPPA